MEQDAGDNVVQGSRLPLGGAGAPWLLSFQTVRFQTGISAGWVGGAKRTGLMLASDCPYIPGHCPKTPGLTVAQDAPTSAAHQVLSLFLPFPQELSLGPMAYPARGKQVLSSSGGTGGVETAAVGHLEA